MIEAQQLVKDYGTFRAVDGVTFEVKPGEVLGFLGPNGAGKSTTMKMLTGFLTPTSGTARIAGHDIRQEPIAAKKRFGYLPESGPLYPEMTVAEFLGFAADLRELSEKRGTALHRVRELCHLEKVWDQPIDTLSKGFRQRVGMAQAILHEPGCLIMDEPTDGLDPNQKRAVRDLIASMASDKAIILSTHILEEVSAMCTRVIIIDRGKVVFNDRPAALAERHPQHGAVVLRFEGAPPANWRETLSGITSVEKVDLVDEKPESGVIVFPRASEAIQGAVAEAAQKQSWAIAGIAPAPTPLEEVFYDLTQAS